MRFGSSWITHRRISNPLVVLMSRVNPSVDRGLSQFKIEQNGTNWTWITDQLQNGTVNTGTTNVGGSFAYGGCSSGSISFVNVLYQGSGTAGVCSFLQVVASPVAVSGDIEAVDCEDAKFSAGDSKVTVNPDVDCVCGNPISSQETNWSRIKALYQ